MPNISRLALAQMVKARLDTIPHSTVYLGAPTNVPLLANSDKVAPYAALYSGDGAPLDETPLTAVRTGSLVWPFQVTFAAGYEEHLLQLLDDGHAVLDGWLPTLAGYQFAPLTQPPGYDAGPIRVDRAVEPARLFLPAQFLLPVALA